MPLHALDRELAGQRAAPAVLDHVAEGVHRGRLANHAVVQPLAARLEGLHHLHRAVMRRAFLVAGDQEGDGAGVGRMLGHEFLHGDHEAGDGGLHVRRAPAVELAVAVGGLERVRLPLVHRAGRHHVGMAGEGQQLACRARRAALHRPQVGHAEVVRAADEVFAYEAEGLQAGFQHGLAAFVSGRDGAAADQVFGQGEGGVHVAVAAGKFRKVRRSRRRKTPR
ncbi:hypothetical protein D3C81_1348810 [compost metagenome]